MNLVEQFGNSLWNFRSYRSLSQTKGGKSFLYIFLLFLIIYLISNTVTVVRMDSVIEYLQSGLMEFVPDFHLSNGKLTVDSPEPIRLEEGSYLMVVDTTGQTTLDDFEGVTDGLLITDTEMVVIENGRTETTPFSLFGPLELSKDQVAAFLPRLKGIVIAGLAIWFVFAFAGKLFGILMLSIIAIIATSIFRQQLTFANQWNIAIYASTLPMLIKLANTLLGGPLTGFMFIIYWGVAITYVFVAISKMSDTDQAEPIPAAVNPDSVQ